jgi:hypothetical protein
LLAVVLHLRDAFWERLTPASGPFHLRLRTPLVFAGGENSAAQCSARRR